MLKALFTLLVLSLCVACNSEEVTPYSSPGITFTVPVDWEVFEDVEVNDQHRSINLVTSRGTMVSVDVLRYQVGDEPVELNTYVKRYIASALPTDDIKASASFDLGVQTRSGHKGMFVQVSTPEPSASAFLVEVYQLVTNAGAIFVVFNTPDAEVDFLQQDFDRFLSSVAF